MQLNIETIKAARVAKGWTQQQLADVAGLSIRTIQRIENAGTSSIESCNALCAVLEVERTALLQTYENQPPQTHRHTEPQWKAFVFIFVAGAIMGAGISALLK